MGGVSNGNGSKKPRNLLIWERYGPCPSLGLSNIGIECTCGSLPGILEGNLGEAGFMRLLCQRVVDILVFSCGRWTVQELPRKSGRAPHFSKLAPAKP